MTRKLVTTLTVSTTVQALHSWPAAHDIRDYLRNVHAHDFKVTATFSVQEADRELEFHDLRDLLGTAVELVSLRHPEHSGLRHFGTDSCETIAAKVAEALETQLKCPARSVTVAEDETCSATVEVTYQEAPDA